VPRSPLAPRPRLFARALSGSFGAPV